MPTYQYACTECNHRFEAVQSFSDAALTACPACEGRLRKVFNAVGVVFKGSGFYRTDSRSANGSERSGADAGSPAKSATGSSSDGASGSSSPSGSGTPVGSGASTGSSSAA